MTLPPVVRVFFAVGLPDSIREKIKRVISDIKKITKNHAIRFTLPENLHVTLQFVGEVAHERLPFLISKVQARLDQEMLRHEFEFNKLSVLPNPFRPRVVVLEIKVEEKMARLAKVIAEGINEAGFAVEKRSFRGHLTLGRIKQPRVLDFGFLGEVVVPRMDAISVKEIALYRSEPFPEGSHYTVIETLALRE